MTDSVQNQDSNNKSPLSNDMDDFDKPIQARQIFDPNFKFGDVEETLKEIDNFKIKTSRPLIKMQFIKKRREFGQPFKPGEMDASEKMTDIKQQNDPFMHQKNRVIDIGLQGCNPLTNTATQTTWNRKINTTIQMVDEDMAIEYEDENADLLNFLQNVYPLMEEALQSNETIDIYMNDFELFTNDGDIQQEGTQELSNTIKETKTFFEINCNQKKISSIQFQPASPMQKGKFIAVSYMENLQFDDRVNFNCRSHKNYIVLWDYDDQHSIEPVLILTSPFEILCFSFNPKDPNIVIGGAINGQVLMWDLKLSPQLQAASSKRKQQTNKEKSATPELAPALMSQLQDISNIQTSQTTDILKKNIPSHKNPVLCLQWLPNTIEVDKRQFSLLVPPQANEVRYFATISCDGQVLIWDSKPYDTKNKHQQLSATELQNVIWKALYGVQLFRPAGGGQMGGAQIAFRKNQKQFLFTGTSDEGELYLLDLVAAVDPSKDMVQKIWQKERSFRPPVGLDVSPFFDDIILTLHDFHFCIWKHEVDLIPIFESNIVKGAQITCGAFSPTRPGVVMIGLSDGHLEIWDFIDQSHKCTQSYTVGAKCLSFLKFHDINSHHLAIGDVDGYVHRLELPNTLWKKIGPEEKTIQDFWDREVQRVKYFEERFEIRAAQFKAEKDKKEQQDQLEEQKKQKQQQDEKKEDEEDEQEKEYQLDAQKYLETIRKDFQPNQVEQQQGTTVNAASAKKEEKIDPKKGKK